MNNGQMGPNNLFLSNNSPQNGESNEDALKQFKSSRKLTFAANIMGPVSLFFGGTLLSSIGVICAVLGLKKMKALSIGATSMASNAKIALKASKVALGVCIVALVLNVITMMFLFNEMSQAIETGNYSTFLESMGISNSGSGNSTWG